MANVLIEQTTMEDIADAIRSKNGLSNTYKPAQMPTAIANLPTGATLQSKSATPTESAQTIAPDTGYDGLSSVAISAISSTYVGSGVTRQTAATVEDGILDFLEDENAIIIPEGYYDDVVSIELNAVFPQNPTISVSNSGLITASYTINNGYLNSNNASASHSATQQLTTKAAATYTPSSSVQTISAGQYLTGAQTIAALNNQNKNVTPTESTQSITADSGYTGLGTVSVGAISSTYIGSDITRRSSSDLTASGATVTVPAGYYESQGTKSVATGTAGTPSASKGTVSNHSISITPSVTNTTGYISGGTKTGTAVSVTASELVSGTKSITANGTSIDVTNYAAVDVAVPGDSPVINSLAVTPSESEQTFNSASVDGYKPVTVSAISSTYVGSDITRRSSTDLSASGATVTVPAGYYSSQASKSVTTMTLPTSAASSATSGYTSKATISRSTSAQYINIPPGYNSAGGYYTISATANGSVTAPSSISGTSATVSTGTNTLTLTKTVSVTPNVTTAGYISSGIAGNSSVSLTASVTTKAAATITPGTTNQTIASGTYLTGTQTIAGDADLIGSNIISTANIFNVQGTVVINKYYTGSSAPSSSLGNNGDIYLQS